MGIHLIGVTFPEFPYDALRGIIPANRVRTLAIRAFAKIFEKVDLIVTSTSGPSNQVAVTNLA